MEKYSYKKARAEAWLMEQQAKNATGERTEVLLALANLTESRTKGQIEWVLELNDDHSFFQKDNLYPSVVKEIYRLAWLIKDGQVTLSELFQDWMHPRLLDILSVRFCEWQKSAPTQFDRRLRMATLSPELISLLGEVRAYDLMERIEKAFKFDPDAMSLEYVQDSLGDNLRRLPALNEPTIYTDDVWKIFQQMVYLRAGR